MRTFILNKETYPVKIVPSNLSVNPDLMRFENMPKQYKWFECFDEYENSIWTLTSPYEEGFTFRLKQRLFNNKIEWVENHDAELRGAEWPEFWSDLSEAKATIERCYENILQDNSN